MQAAPLAPAAAEAGATGVPAGRAAGATVPSSGASYRDIVRSFAMIGGSSALVVGLGMVRTKAMALMLGPAGYGVFGAYVQICELATSAAQIGINASGVRQIAEAHASQRPATIALTAAVLRCTSVLLGFVGALAVVSLAAPICVLTFGDASHRAAVALLGLAVFFSVMTGACNALLQGMRRIGDLARLGLWGGVLSTAAAIGIVYVRGEDGLAFVVVAASAISLGVAWAYCRRIALEPVVLGRADFVAESSALLRLGLAFMASGLLMTGAAYAVRTIVLRVSGPDAAGSYYAAWTLGGVYLGFVLQALATDFYPRLVGVADDHDACNRVVNEQAQVSILLAVPGVLVTLTVAPWVVSLFYSTRFAPAVDILRWLCLGMALRVLTWPIGYIVVAKNRQTLFFAMELAWTVVNVGLTWWLVGAFGATGAGIAFFVSYVFHTLLVFPAAWSLTRFRWSVVNVRLAAGAAIAVALVFVGFQVLAPAQALAAALVVTAASSFVCFRMLVLLVVPERLPRPLARFLSPRSSQR